MSTFIFPTLLIILLLFLLAIYLRKLYYWKRQNVPAIWSTKLVWKLRNSNMALMFAEIYQTMYAEGKPMKLIASVFTDIVIVQDLETINDIMVKKFEYFPERGLYINHRDALSTNIISLNHKLWKQMRLKFTSTLTPSKIKFMFPTLLKVGKELATTLREQINQNGSEVAVCELCARFSIDIIGNVAFGIECNSLKDPNDELFKRSSSVLIDLNINPLLIIILTKYERFFNVFNIKGFKSSITKFLTKLVQETMEHRERHMIRRNDFLDILMELRKTDKSISLEMIVGQVFAFLIAGYDTSSHAMAYALYELAKNPKIQDKARESIMDVLKRSGNAFTYDNLQDMVYLQQIFQETLRMYPVVPATPRICRKTVAVATKDSSITIPAGTAVAIPIYGIHHNAEFYPEPDLFRPERFTEHEISQRPIGAYMPFGAGPRGCIGERFAKMQVTLGLAILLTQFRFLPCDKMSNNLVFDPKNYFVLSTKNELFLKVEKL